MSLELETLQTTAVFENGFLRGTERLPQFDGETVQVVVIRIKSEEVVTDPKTDESPTFPTIEEKSNA